MFKRAVYSLAVGAVITADLAVAVVAIAPEAPAARTVADDMHPNLVRTEGFTPDPTGASIEQDVPTQPGATYRLSFDYAEHPLGSPGAAAFDITFGTTTLSVPVPIGAADQRRFTSVEAPAIDGLTRLTFTQVAPGLGPLAFPDHIVVRRLS